MLLRRRIINVLFILVDIVDNEEDLLAAESLELDDFLEQVAAALALNVHALAFVFYELGQLQLS